ncbi:MAG: Co2+/Mg2+ efflux protein ApaG [Gammaproteobacteria bacterium]|nr:Co2+/Mg2+ efflux protein ApaG [Gammaproteobacteria bacterium]
MSSDTTHKIDIQVTSHFIAGQSDPAQDRYVFSYTITIRNLGECTAQLMSRHWIITDANGNQQEVRGDGVVGEQPSIAPGDGFQYTSGAVLKTPVGSMYGYYHMVTPEGDTFAAAIEPFTLAVPGLLH